MSKELLFRALRNEKTERVPWLPFVGCHGGALIGETAENYLKSSELIIKGIGEAIQQYRPDGIPVVFDLQIEAEALGCDLQWADDNPPAVVNHILAEKELSEMQPISENDGRIPIVLDAMRNLSATYPDVAFYGLITGPFTLALHLRGTNIFMDIYDQPEYVQKLLAFTTQIGINMADYYLKAGCDVIAVVDPMTSQISPQTFGEFVTPAAQKVFAHIRNRDALSSFFVCGHAQKNVEAMCMTNPDNICIDENIDLNYVKEVTRKYNVSYGGNLKLTLSLLMGNENDVKKDALQCMQIGGDTGFILAPGCDLPYATPPENLKAIASIIYDPYQRDVAMELLKKQDVVTLSLNFDDYGRGDKVIVDIITLDSEGCAPCQYMVEAVKAVAPNFGELVEWREHKIKHRESVEFMMAMMVKNIPTICIDGKITFVSQIPAQNELIQAIQNRINEKFKLKLHLHHNRLLLLGKQDEKFSELTKVVQQALLELGSTVEVELITEEEKVNQYSLAALPAVIAVKEDVKETGRIPSIDAVKEWLKDLA